ncbi:MAG: ferrous iron transport protein B [Clostridiales bacterium]|nr:ferrous iron transport protein B [Candidatus Apopatousia equi]
MKKKKGQAVLDKNEYDYNILLVGNPNTGKTTFFNAITNSDEHVGNWHGVTVDFKEKITKFENLKLKITDLPGLYSLSSYSYEEGVARDYIYNHQENVISLCDANNLSRNLYLTIQLLEMGIKPTVCINMANELKKSNKQILTSKLSEKLNLDINLLNAQKKDEVKKIIEKVIKGKGVRKVETNSQQDCSINVLACDKVLDYIEKLPLEKVKNILGNSLDNLPILNEDFVAIKVLEKDEFVLKILNLSGEQKECLKEYWENESEVLVAKSRYEFIDRILKDCVIVGDENKESETPKKDKKQKHKKEKNKDNEKFYGYSKLDKIILNKYLALPIFLGLICLIFYLTFSSVGKSLSGLLSTLLNKYIASPCISFVETHTSNAFIVSFVSDAIFGGVGSLISFLPQIVILFLSLSILEDSGYMSRLAFTLEDYFSKIGLTGKSVFTLLMGFGCSTTACMTSRNLEDKNSKIKTAMLAPYISCSAKIPIYTVICGAFFKQSLPIIILLYILSVIVAVVVSFVLEKTVLKSGEQSFIMELPPYRFPKFSRILKLVWQNIKSFVLRVGTMIVSFSVIVWILQSCDFTFRFNPDNSILKVIGKVLSPLFTPLGFGSWGAVACLICGIVAKEVIVGTMGIINNISESTNSTLLISQSLLLSTSALCFNPCSALSFLVFSLLYAPCISTIGVMAKEIGSKWTFIACLIQFAIAYILSFAVYRISLCFTINGILSGIISLVCFIAIIALMFVAIKIIKKKKYCKFCKGECENK